MFRRVRGYTAPLTCIFAKAREGLQREREKLRVQRSEEKLESIKRPRETKSTTREGDVRRLREVKVERERERVEVQWRN